MVSSRKSVLVKSVFVKGKVRSKEGEGAVTSNVLGITSGPGKLDNICHIMEEGQGMLTHMATTTTHK